MMIFRTVGTVSPVWDVAPEGDAAAAAAGGDPNAGKTGAEGGAEGGFVFDAEKAFADLPADTREWLQKGDYGKDVKALATKAHAQEKLIGSSIRVPGEDATEDERNAFLDKLGRPKSDADYKFEAPKNMPEGLPYDEQLDKSFRGVAHKLGLSQAQAAGLRDMFVEYQVGAYNGVAEKTGEQLAQRVTAATEAMEKKWGKIDGDTAKANFEVADRVFTMAPGGQELLAELKAIGLVGPNKEIFSAPLAFTLASIGQALYAEDGALKGDTDLGKSGNPYTKEGWNLTLQSKLWKEDPEQARSLIAAAGLKPSDLGLPG
jgi:hypothetical protein